MTSTSNDDRSAVEWTWDDNNQARNSDWLVHESPYYPHKIVALGSMINDKGEAAMDIERREWVQRRAEQGDELCRRALAYVAMKRLTS